jgi:hypothetical protein
MNPDRICWQLGPGGQATVIFFILAGDADAWAYHNFFGMKLASLNIRAHKTTPKKL